MKIIAHIAAVALMFVLSGSACAKIIYASGTANTEISLGFSNDVGYLDVNGDGKADSFNGRLVERIRDTFGAPDAKKIVRHTVVNSRVIAYYNPLTGALIGKSTMLTHILRFDENNAFRGAASLDQGIGIFTVGAKRYFTQLRGAESAFIPDPLLIGTPYIDASLSVVIFNTKTGASVKRFTIQSNATWRLLPGECRFADINGVTRFIERYAKRDTAVPPAPPFVTRNPLLVKVWNATHTVLIKQFIQPNTTRVVP